jgi:hypothetical protein
MLDYCALHRRDTRSERFTGECKLVTIDASCWAPKLCELQCRLACACPTPLLGKHGSVNDVATDATDTEIGQTHVSLTIGIGLGRVTTLAKRQWLYRKRALKCPVGIGPCVK